MAKTFDDSVDPYEDTSPEKKDAVIEWPSSTLKPPWGVDLAAGEDHTVGVVGKFEGDLF